MKWLNEFSDCGLLLRLPMVCLWFSYFCHFFQYYSFPSVVFWPGLLLTLSGMYLRLILLMGDCPTKFLEVVIFPSG